MKKRKQEFAIIGLGMFGRSIALTLTEKGYDVLGIDIDQTIVQEFSDQLSQTACLDATNEAALKSVDITSFNTVIVCIGTDFESNLMITVALKNLGVTKIICKALTDQQQAILLKIGADRVILPERKAGRRLANELVMPWLNDEIDLGSEHSLTEVSVPPSLVGQSLVSADIRNNYGVTILVIKNHVKFIVSPPGTYVLTENDTLVIVGSHKQIDHFLHKA